MNGDIIALRELLNSDGYKILQGIWLQHTIEIEEARDRCAGRGHESAWRYWAGQEKGFKMAMMTLQKTIDDFEKENKPDEGQTYIEELLKSVRGETK